MTSPLSKIQDALFESSKTLAETSKQAQLIETIARELVRALRSGGKILLCGNGGSAADSQHFACELVGSFLIKTRRALPVVALTTNSSNLTAIGNDFDFTEVFRRQVEALGRPGDVLIAISTSGNSPNVLKAADQARKQKMVVIGLSGGTGGKLKSRCDLCLVVPNSSTPRIQETHIAVIHVLCALAEEELSKRIGLSNED